MRASLANGWKVLTVIALLLVTVAFVALRFDPAGGLKPAARKLAGGDREQQGMDAPAAPCSNSGGLIIPVRGVAPAQLSDTFADARSEGRRHDAIDIMAPTGTPVIAAAPGRLEKLFLSRAGGTTAYVRSPDGRTIYYYAHLDRYAPGLREGRVLKQGAPIGFVGYSGNADPTAPHLHFAVMATAPGRRWWDETRALNPYPLLATRGGC